jgi:hypothetical protein
MELHELVNEITRQSLKVNHACQLCAWAHPDTCKQCRVNERTVVLAITKDGIKREGQ